MAATPSIGKIGSNKYQGNLALELAEGATSFSLVSATGPAGQTLPTTDFYVAMEYDTTDKYEIIYVESRSGVVCTVSSDGRGRDGTSDTTHAPGANVRVVLPSELIRNFVDNFKAEHSDAGVHTWDGWLTDTGTWSSPSFADTNGESTLTVTVASDATTKYSAGMRVKFTQDATVKQGIITSVAETALTIFVNTDYTGTANAITLPYYSSMKCPFGFDMSPSKYTIITRDTSHRTQASPTQNVWYNINAPSITVPIGSWDVDYSVNADLLIAAGSATDKNLFIQTTLSKANNSEDDVDFTSTFGLITSTSATAVFTARANMQKRKLIEITTADVYYLNTRTTESGITSLRNLNALDPLIIRATLAYL